MTPVRHGSLFVNEKRIFVKAFRSMYCDPDVKNHPISGLMVHIFRLIKLDAVHPHLSLILNE